MPDPTASKPSPDGSGAKPRPKAEPPAPVQAPGRASARAWLYGFGAAVLAGGVGYGTAHLQGRSMLAAADAQARQAATARAEAERAAEARELARASRVQALEARRELHRVVMSLDARNFGIARDALARARSSLEAAKDPALDSVAKRLEAYEPSVSDDVGADRGALLDIAGALDAALDASAGGAP